MSSIPLLDELWNFLEGSRANSCSVWQGVNWLPYKFLKCSILFTNLSAPYKSTKRKGPPHIGGKPNPKTAAISPSTYKNIPSIFLIKKFFRRRINFKITNLSYGRIQNAFLQAHDCFVDETWDHSQLQILHAFTRRQKKHQINTMSIMYVCNVIRPDCNVRRCNAIQCSANFLYQTSNTVPMENTYSWTLRSMLYFLMRFSTSWLISLSLTPSW